MLLGFHDKVLICLDSKCTVHTLIVWVMPSMQNAWVANYTGCAITHRAQCKCASLSVWAEVVNRGRVPHCLRTCRAPVTRLLSNATMVPFAMSRNYPERWGLRDWTGVMPLSANPQTQPEWVDINTKPGLVFTLSGLLRHLVIILHRISISYLWKCCPASRINSLGSCKLARNTRLFFANIGMQNTLSLMSKVWFMQQNYIHLMRNTCFDINICSTLKHNISW